MGSDNRSAMASWFVGLIFLEAMPVWRYDDDDDGDIIVDSPVSSAPYEVDERHTGHMLRFQ